MRTYEEKIDKTESCWNWTGSITASGYGQIWQPAKKHTPAHRYIYELHVGKIPDGLEIDHLCRNRRCVNPKHLEPVTSSENIRRAWAVRLKPHCQNGHPYNKQNLYHYESKDGKKSRMCRICRYNYLKQYRIKKRKEKR